MKKRLFYAAIVASMAATVAVAPAQAQQGFADISADSSYAEATTWLKEQGIITGYSDGTYRPQQPISRQHLLKIISEVIDLPSQRQAVTFADVEKSSPYYEVIQWAYTAGLVDGDGGKFYPQKSLTRAHAAKILTRAFQLQRGETTVSFLDVTPDHWAYDAIQTLAAHDITNTAGGHFKPSAAVTRGQMALFLHRLLKEEVDMPQVTGNWTGELALPQGNLTVQLHFQPDGSGSISLPAQGISKYPISQIEQKGQQIELTVQLGDSKISLQGKLQDNVIKATFIQGGMSFPITFKAFDMAPVTYEEVVIDVTGGKLKAALQMPETEQPVPLAIIIAGSGATTKDGNSIGGENNSLKMLAEDLAAQGIATIRYDKRGVGENMALMKKEEDLSVGLYAEDVQNIIAYAETDKRFSSIHIIGHSEGSLVGLLAASKKQVASFTSVAGAGRALDETLIGQLSPQLPPDLLATAKHIIAELKKGNTVDGVPELFYDLFRPSVQPYLISLFQPHPAALLQQLKTRSLIVQGKNDIQVPVAEAEHFKQYAPQAETLYFEKMNHVLKDAPTDLEGNIATYSNPTLPLTDGLVEGIAKFIKK